MAVPEPTNYDEIAEDYAPIADELPANKYWERPTTLRLLPPLSGLDVLDAGCGAGFYSDHASAAGGRVVGFDPSEKMVAYAKGRLGDRVELHHCTTEQLLGRLGGRKFDLIISALVLHYVQNLKREMRLLASLLKPKGKMVVSMRHPFLYGYVMHGYRKAVVMDQEWSCGTVTFIQRPLWRMMEAFELAGLVVEHIDEAAPDPELEQAAPEIWAKTRARPFFIHFVLSRR
jgi:SAM-dependent methyltransferase